MIRRTALLAAGAWAIAAHVAPPSRLPFRPSGPKWIARAAGVAIAEAQSDGRDPFRPVPPDRPAAPSFAPLRRYELRELAVAGTISGPSAPRALVEDDAGTGFVVSVGTPVGRAGGVVEAIGRLLVVVAEPGFDADGQPRTVRVALRAREPAASSQARPKPTEAAR